MTSESRSHEPGVGVQIPRVNKPLGRILAIDWGERRMGLALSDPLGLTAQGLPTAARRNTREDLNFLHALARRHKVSLIVVGNPLNLDGSEGPPSAKARAFAAALTRTVGAEVELWDERLTSVEAEARLGGIGGSSAVRLPGETDRTKRRERVDQLAATILLQSYLDTRRMRAGRNQGMAPEPEAGHEE